MSKDTNISIIQLIKAGEIDVEFEISNLQAGYDINISIHNYLKKSPDYNKIAEQIERCKANLNSCEDGEKSFYATKLENLQKVEHDFIINALLLAKAFSTMEIRTERLKKAKELFEQGRIKEADKILKESELLQDQTDLIAHLKYLEIRKKYLTNEATKDTNLPQA